MCAGQFTAERVKTRMAAAVMDLGEVSARGVDRVIRLAWTVADLGGVPRPTAAEVSYALGLWLGVMSH